MKKQAMAALLVLSVSLISVFTVMAGYLFGPGNCFHMEAKAGVALKGNWVEGTMSPATVDGYAYKKRVYARSGADGSYSAWEGPSIYSVTHRDYGSFSDDYAEVRGEWK